MAANESTGVTLDAAGQRGELGIRLQPVNQSDQPIFNGRLACRIALGVEAAAQLTQQLGQHLASLQPKPQKAADPKASGPAK